MKNCFTILNVLPLSSSQKEAFEAQSPDSIFVYKNPKEVDKNTSQQADVIIGNIAPHLIDSSSQLKWLQLNTAGADWYLNKSVLAPHTKLTNATGAYGLAISEHMLGMVLAIQKKLYLYRDNQNQAIWADEGLVSSIEGSRTLIIGAGDIGGTFAKKMKALGSYTIGVKRNPSPKPDYLDELFLSEDLDMLLPTADIVALSVPGNQETHHLFTKERLLKMKPSAILLNVGRGNAIDTPALCEVLQSGHLQGVGLDVTDPEPLPSDHPLWHIKNAIITPHISGHYHLPETLNRIIEISIRNLGHFIKEEPLENEVDFVTGYRKSY